jgi:formamidopyrimidine-DNA glycosylase
MPELPDVEVFGRYLGSTALHKRIDGVTVNDARILRNVSGSRLSRGLRGRRMEGTRRRGKHLLVELDSGSWLTLHFGMTGSLVYLKRMAGDRRHDRVILSLANGYRLIYVCSRLLGRVGLVKDAEAFIQAKGLGPDALRLDPDGFKEIVNSSRASIKSTLMDQSRLAGLGNIYSDEMLFQAGVGPRRKAGRLGNREMDGLFRSMQKVLRTAIERKADPHRLPRTWLVTHRREGAACPRCGGKVRKITLAGRSTYYCPSCQSDRRAGR